MMSKCSYEVISQSNQRCEHVREYCKSAGLINFEDIYYCRLDENMHYFFPLSLSCLGLAFFYLSHVADEHLSLSLQKIAKTFKFSESLAGVTLLAFGSGATDVFASLSASEDADPAGVQMGISVLLGSSLFILSIITSLVVLASP